MKKENIFWGVFFLLGAVFLIVGKLGFLSGVGIWTLLFSILLAAMLVKSVLRLSPTGILFSLAFFCILYAEPLHLEALTPWPVLGAAALGSIGCGLLFGRRRARRRAWHGEEHFDRVDQVSGDCVDFSTSFGSSIKYVHSDRFQRASIHCSFGAMKVYFDNAVVRDGAAVVDLDVSFSGVELYVPSGWNVVNDASASLGGIEIPSGNGNGPLVTLTGNVSLGGVEVFYV